jgi:hypothetical protein
MSSLFPFSFQSESLSVSGVCPFVPLELEKENQKETSSDEQPIRFVVYVWFESRAVLGRDQMREIQNGLMKSGHKFLWVVKVRLLTKKMYN